MKKAQRRGALVFVIAAVLCVGAVKAAEFPPTDHAGADLILSDGDVIWGLHEGVNRFVVPAGAVVTVRSYNGNPATGILEVFANDIEVRGRIEAQGVGYPGGAGGGGGGGTSIYGFTGSLAPGFGGLGGNAASPSEGIAKAGEEEIAGEEADVPALELPEIDLDDVPDLTVSEVDRMAQTVLGSPGGNGAAGQGAFGLPAAGGFGGPGARGVGTAGGGGGPGGVAQPAADGGNGGTGQDGGYLEAGGNGDTTTNPDVLMGSGGGGAGGGGGGGGGDPGVVGKIAGGGGGGGGAGGIGGGAVKLFSVNSIVVNGSIDTRGADGGANGADGFNAVVTLLNAIGGNGGVGADSTLLGEAATVENAWMAETEEPAFDLPEVDFDTVPDLIISEADKLAQTNDLGLGGLGGRGIGDRAIGIAGNGGDGGQGGAGGGGGIIMFCMTANGIDLNGARLDARGGRGQLDSGGTIKIFFKGLDPTVDAAAILAGRVLKQGILRTRHWRLYR